MKSEHQHMNSKVWVGEGFESSQDLGSLGIESCSELQHFSLQLHCH
jgi:hypothetical protein